MVENQRFRLPQGLDRVKAPTLTIAGKHEYAAMRQSASDLATAIPGAQAYEVVYTEDVARLFADALKNLSKRRTSTA